MSELYSYFDLELYYFTPYTLWSKTKAFGYNNPFAQRYINFTHLLIVKGHYGFGYDTYLSPPGWRPLNKDEL